MKELDKLKEDLFDTNVNEKTSEKLKNKYANLHHEESKKMLEYRKRRWKIESAIELLEEE